MGYKRFEEIPVWNDAIALAVETFDLSATGCLGAYAGFRDQMERAAVSVSNNIAEGYERGSNAELMAFLYIARGSCGEVRSMSNLLERLPAASDHGDRIAHVKGCAEGVSRQLGKWLEYLKDSDFQRSKSRNTQARDHDDRLRLAHQFEETLRRVRSEAPPRPPSRAESEASIDPSPA